MTAVTRPCEECGTSIVYRTGGAFRRFCDACRVQRHAERQAAYEARKRGREVLAEFVHSAPQSDSSLRV